MVRIQATPANAADGPHLATEVLEAVARETRRGDGDGADGNGAAARTNDDPNPDGDEDAAAKSGDADATHRDDAAKLGAAAGAVSGGGRDG